MSETTKYLVDNSLLFVTSGNCLRFILSVVRDSMNDYFLTEPAFCKVSKLISVFFEIYGFKYGDIIQYPYTLYSQPTNLVVIQAVWPIACSAVTHGS